jgi:SpoIIAA-like
MPITVTVNAAERVRYSVVSGDVADKELIATFRRSIEAPDFDPSLNALVDLRAARTLDVTSNGIWELSRVLSAADRSGASRRVAIVASSDFQFGMARMAATLLSTGGAMTTEYMAFREMAEARRWLGLDPDAESGG